MTSHQLDSGPALRNRETRICFWAAAGLVVFTALPLHAQTAAEYFRLNCASCHTIGGGRLTGPDLKDLTARRDRTWLVQFMPNPKAMIDGGDPIAVSLAQEARGVVMPALPTMTPARIQELLDFLDAESKLARSQFAGSPVSDRPFTAQDVAVGRSIFVGQQRLKSGAPSCVSCHTVGGLGALGGGRLGPDLTLVLERLQGRKGVTAWLGAPATSTMQSVFQTAALQPDEILSLVAFLDDTARTARPADSVAQLNFFMLGLGGAVFGLGLADAVWKRRFRAVRRPLVRGDDAGGAR